MSENEQLTLKVGTIAVFAVGAWILWGFFKK